MPRFRREALNFFGSGQKVGPGRRTGPAEAHPELNEVKGFQAPHSQNYGSEKKSKQKELTRNNTDEHGKHGKGRARCMSIQAPWRLCAELVFFGVFCFRPCFQRQSLRF